MKSNIIVAMWKLQYSNYSLALANMVTSVKKPHTFSMCTPLKTKHEIYNQILQIAKKRVKLRQILEICGWCGTV
jgi:hypothetical protein